MAVFCDSVFEFSRILIPLRRILAIIQHNQQNATGRSMLVWVFEGEPSIAALERTDFRRLLDVYR
jgi:hypothetical protein